MTDLQSTLDAIAEATACQQCRQPLEASPSSIFCSESCQADWNSGIAGSVARFTLRWKHPNLGRIEEYVCKAHCDTLNAALTELAIGCIGTLVDVLRPCHRCATTLPPRLWIERFKEPA